jgi:anti-anti-sigma factor
MVRSRPCSTLQRLPRRPSSPCSPDAVLRLVGELDIANCEEIVAAVGRLCRRGRREVRVDLGAVTFLDAAGVGGLLRARERGLAAGCAVVLVGVHGWPLRVLRVLGLDTVLIDGAHHD